MKPGYKTTEFWLIAAVVVLTLLGAVTDLLPDSVAATVSALLPSIYAALRVIAKLMGASQRLRELELELDLLPPPKGDPDA